MDIFGLIGYPLSHSFSKKYFTEKFQKEGIQNSEYRLFEIDDIQKVKGVIAENPGLKGLNVTIPYKQAVLPFLDETDHTAQKIGAVNVVKVNADGSLKGFNSDYFGFKNSLVGFMGPRVATKALILGTGGASKAVRAVLEDLDIPFAFVSRNHQEGFSHPLFTYGQLTAEIMGGHQLIVNTSPLGMSPNTASFPEIPYQALTGQHYLYDLVYNPEQTTFMQKGAEQGARVKNGLEMLYLQAEESWRVWNAG